MNGINSISNLPIIAADVIAKYASPQPVVSKVFFKKTGHLKDLFSFAKILPYLPLVIEICGLSIDRSRARSFQRMG